MFTKALKLIRGSLLEIIHQRASMFKIVLGLLLGLLGTFLKSSSYTYSGLVRNAMADNPESAYLYFESIALTYATLVLLEKFTDKITQLIYMSIFSEASLKLYLNTVDEINQFDFGQRSKYADEKLHSEIKVACESVQGFFTSSLNIIRIGIESLYFGYIISNNSPNLLYPVALTLLYILRAKLNFYFNNDLKKSNENCYDMKTLLYKNVSESFARHELVLSNSCFLDERTKQSSLINKYNNLLNLLIVKQIKLFLIEKSISVLTTFLSILASYYISLPSGKNGLKQFQYFFSCFLTLERNIDQVLTESKTLFELAIRILYLSKINQDLLYNREKRKIFTPQFLITEPPAIDFDNVTLTINGKMVLQNISFSVGKGKLIVIMGESGSGKSMLARLLMGFYQPTSGKIRINGVTLISSMMPSVRNNVGYISQSAYILSGSIAENICYGWRDCHSSKMSSAIELAGLKEYVLCNNDKYETVIEDGGKSLSEGIKQKFSIARIFLRSSLMYIFDDPVHSLDKVSKKHAIENLLKHIRGSTSLIFTHEKQIADQADCILVLKNGQIIEKCRRAPKPMNEESKDLSSLKYGVSPQ